MFCYLMRFHFVAPEASDVLLFAAVPCCGTGSLRWFVICCGTILWLRELATFCNLVRYHFVAPEA